MTVEKMAMTNKNIRQKLIKHLNPSTLLNLRGTSKEIEETLSSDQEFVEKAFTKAIYTETGEKQQKIPLGMQKLKLFIMENMTDARDRYQFARDIININEQAQKEWDQYRQYGAEKAARHTFCEVQELIKQNWEKGRGMIEFDDEFETLHAQACVGSMYGKLSDLHLEINHQEEALTKITRKEYHCANQQRRDELTKRKHIEELSHKAVHSAYTLKFLVTKLFQIQNAHMMKILDAMVNRSH